MRNVSIEESRKQVPSEALGAIHVYRQHTDFSQFVMDVIETIREMDLQRVVILVQKGVSEAVVDDAAQRIAELLEGEKHSKEGRNIALECFHGLTRAELRRLKRQWQQSRRKRKKTLPSDN